MKISTTTTHFLVENLSFVWQQYPEYGSVEAKAREESLTDVDVALTVLAA